MKFTPGATASSASHNFAIVDEVDSILIDEARTPLIISGPTEESTDKYYQIDRIIPRWCAARRSRKATRSTPPATTWSTRRRTPVALTEEGVAKVEKLARHREPLRHRTNIEMLHHVKQALRAHHALQARRRLRRQGRRGHHRRRVHRPPDARPPLVATACTRRSRPRKA